MSDPYGDEVRTTTTTTSYDPVTDREVRTASVTRRTDGSNPLVWVIAIVAIIAIVALVYFFVQANKRDQLAAEAALSAQPTAMVPYDQSSAAFDQSVAAAQAANLANQTAAAQASNQAANQMAMSAAQQAAADRAAASADRAAAERAASEARASANEANRAPPMVVDAGPPDPTQ